MNCCSKGADEMADIIKVEHLSYVYNPGLPTAVTALDDVSFTVEAVSYTHLTLPTT